MEFFIARIWKICATIRVIELIFTVEDDRLYTYIYTEAFVGGGDGR